tara:strand:- start:436 stop:813 length:378 start_codon:yes stop_codon:yes gene_type:complete
MKCVGIDSESNGSSEKAEIKLTVQDSSVFASENESDTQPELSFKARITVFDRGTAYCIGPHSCQETLSPPECYYLGPLRIPNGAAGREARLCRLYFRPAVIASFRLFLFIPAALDFIFRLLLHLL